MMNRSLIALICASSLTLTFQTVKPGPDKKPVFIILTSDILQFIDGKAFGINGHDIAAARQQFIEENTIPPFLYKLRARAGKQPIYNPTAK